MSDDTRISADEARAMRDAATPGPWGWSRETTPERCEHTSLRAALQPGERISARVMAPQWPFPSRPDAALLAAAPALADTVIALHAEVASLTEALRRSRESHALDLHALAEWLTPGAAPAEVSGDAVIEAAEAMRDEVEHLRARRGAALEEIDRLREIIEGRTTPPTDAEIDWHWRAGGAWTVGKDPWGGGGADIAHPPYVIEVRDNPRVTWERVWIPRDSDGRPCAWPVVGGAR